jgi:hypothetical protein
MSSSARHVCDPKDIDRYEISTMNASSPSSAVLVLEDTTKLFMCARGRMAAHRSECPLELVPCPSNIGVSETLASLDQALPSLNDRKQGCDYVGPRNTLDQHLADNALVHYHFLAQRLTHTESRLSAMLETHKRLERLVADDQRVSKHARSIPSASAPSSSSSLTVSVLAAPRLPSSVLLARQVPVTGPTEADLRWSKLERIVNRFLASPLTRHARVLAVDQQGKWFIAKIEARLPSTHTLFLTYTESVSS